MISPEEVIEGCEKEIRTEEDIKRMQSMVENKLKPILNNYDKIVVIAGEKYRATLQYFWDDRFVTIKSGGYVDLCVVVAEAIPLGRLFLNS